MTVVSLPDPQTLDTVVSELKEGSRRFRKSSIPEHRELVEACIVNVSKAAKQWVSVVCEAKRISAEKPISAEEVLVGPGCLLRYLRLLSSTLDDFERFGEPQLPGKTHPNSLGQTCVPILPVRSLFDSIIFMGLKAEVWLNEDADDSNLFSERVKSGAEPQVTAVLGAGNVSAIPATDMLFKIFHESEAVLLKFNPVNEYLKPIFELAFAPLIQADLLRLVCGSSETGKAMVDHPEINSIHITGSNHTHEAIVWGSDLETRKRQRDLQQPLVTKTITSELGNVTPWIVVPGKYSRRQLKSQAEQVVASITNNASFNCLATKMLVTSKSWKQRTEFLELVETLLSKVPARYAYYPGAKDRFAKATSKPAPENSDGTLPWTLLRDVAVETSPHLFEEESFTCVCGETSLDAESSVHFLADAVNFVNDKMFGTLCAAITIPSGFRSQHTQQLDKAISKLRYGSVSINQFSGVVYGLMTPPWGGHPSTTLESPESGIGAVHNTFWLKDFDKTVLWGPLWSLPKPVWFSSHRSAARVGWALIRLYEKPSISRLPKLLFHAVLG